MAYEFDLEKVISFLPGAIEDMQNFCNVKVPNSTTAMMDIAKECNTPQVTKDVEYANKSLSELCKMLKSLVGEEGDSVTEGTLFGALSAAEKIQKATGGV